MFILHTTSTYARPLRLVIFIGTVSTSIPYAKWVPTNLMLAEGNPVMDSHPTLRGGRNTLCRFMPLKPEISSGGVEHLDGEERSFTLWTATHSQLVSRDTPAMRELAGKAQSYSQNAS